MTQGLNIGRLVRTTLNLSPTATPRRGFGTLLIVGDSNVINGSERLRSYADLESVVTDFGTLAPEYIGAQLYFGQSPRPQQLMIGRWIRTATAGFLNGGALSSAEQEITLWTAITAGSFKVTIDGALKTLTGLNFSAVTNLNGVATAINAVLTGGTIAWNGSRFVVTSSTTGASSSVAYAVSHTTGTDISAQLKLTLGTASAPISGYASETPLNAVTALSNASGQWYGIAFASDTMPTDDQLVAVAGFIEAASISRVLSITETNANVKDASYTTDLASRTKTLNYKRTTVQYSQNKYAGISFLGRAFSVNFSANRSTITLMYKQEPSVTPELLTETEAQTLKAKRCNVFVQYNNDTAIIQYGTMAGPAYFDEMQGLDWLSDATQNSIYNLLYQSQTKIPQTDAGQTQIMATIASVMQEAVNNGLIASGQWNAEGFGQLKQGDYLPEGFYIFSPPMATQAQSIREQRIAPPIQVAVKLAGAIHEVDGVITVNR
jgi:hypothetical protein